ncbi:3-1 [Durusdinium trenchii]|uniref:3-1 n=1 Tax=Durusdinium trenchii TaxID=1381693 RepID=A0ABP0QLI5_9DINO
MSTWRWGPTFLQLSVWVMVHGDDKGLVLPPNVAGIQVVIVPVGIKATSTEEEKTTLKRVSEEYEKMLQDAGKDNVNSPGWKFNQWEMKGVPLRIELGPNDIAKGTLDEIHQALYGKALKERDERLASVDEWKDGHTGDFSPNLNAGKLVLIPFCGEKECEEKIKEGMPGYRPWSPDVRSDMPCQKAQEVEVAGGLKMGAKSLCIPHEAIFQQRTALALGMARVKVVSFSFICCFNLVIGAADECAKSAAGESCARERSRKGDVLLMQLKPKLKRGAQEGESAAALGMPACCLGCMDWCSPKSGRCHEKQAKAYYKPCAQSFYSSGSLLWADEFDGTELNSSNWVLLEGDKKSRFDLTDSTDHRKWTGALIEDGVLKMSARCEESQARSSAKLSTQDRFDWGPGHRLEIRARFPAGHGVWPAVWMLPSKGGPWPETGEIDIMEISGCDSGKVFAALHTSEFNEMKKNQIASHYFTEYDKWHSYTIDWMPEQINWYVDGQLFHRVSSNAKRWPFNQKFFLNMNMAVNAPWASHCLQDPLPCAELQAMEVDYVRVYQLRGQVA